MSMISSEDQHTLQQLFVGLEGDVTITNFTQGESRLGIPGQECDYCQETHKLLEEVTSLSDKLHLETKDFVREKQEAERLLSYAHSRMCSSGAGQGQGALFRYPGGL